MSPRSVLLRRQDNDVDDDSALPANLRDYFLNPEDIFDHTLDDYEFILRPRDFSAIIKAVNECEFSGQPHSLKVLRTFQRLLVLDCGLEIPRTFLAEVLVEDLANINPFEVVQGESLQNNDLLPTLSTIIMHAQIYDSSSGWTEDTERLDANFQRPSFALNNGEVVSHRLQEKFVVLFEDCLHRMSEVALGAEEEENRYDFSSGVTIIFLRKFHSQARVRKLYIQDVRQEVIKRSFYSCRTYYKNDRRTHKNVGTSQCKRGFLESELSFAVYLQIQSISLKSFLEEASRPQNETRTSIPRST